jgi:hypothetical protein
MMPTSSITMPQCTRPVTVGTAKLPRRCLIAPFRNFRRPCNSLARKAFSLRSVASRQENVATIEGLRLEESNDARKAMLQKILASGLPSNAGCARFGFPKGSLQKSTEELFSRAGMCSAQLCRELLIGFSSLNGNVSAILLSTLLTESEAPCCKLAAGFEVV